MKFLAVLVEPGFFGVVVTIYIHDLGVPVGFLARDIVPTLQNENSLSGWGQVVGERSATSAGSDDDYVVSILAHDANPPFAPQKMQRISLSWWSLQHFTAIRPLRHR